MDVAAPAAEAAAAAPRAAGEVPGAEVAEEVGAGVEGIGEADAAAAEVTAPSGGRWVGLSAVGWCSLSLGGGRRRTGARSCTAGAKAATHHEAHLQQGLSKVESIPGETEDNCWEPGGTRAQPTRHDEAGLASSEGFQV